MSIFRTTILAAFLITASIAAPEEPCFDYTEVLKAEFPTCTARSLFRQIKMAFRELREVNGRCRGGVKHELMALTGTTSIDDVHKALQDLCNEALAEATEEVNDETWNRLQEEPYKIDLNEFFNGYGHLNLETGNFRQYPSSFEKRGGSERFLYIGEDPRLNDHYATTEASYLGGERVNKFYNEEAKKFFLQAPTSNFEQGCRSNTAMCCWQRDRQYLDRNGNCGFNDCSNQNPMDNTDLCWTEEDGTIFPYPGDETENDLHCHGFAWGNDDGGVNTEAKWNNLFFVSMYDHLYQRGYVESITNDPKIAGDQVMCGCVEDMAPVARADCTEAIGLLNYTSYFDPGKKRLAIKHVPDSFELNFRSCRGYDYMPFYQPKDYKANQNDLDLENSNNDLAAFVFRQYLEGKMTDDQVDLVEKTIIGYRNPKVNENDEEREKACANAYKERFGNDNYVEREIEIA